MKKEFINFIATIGFVLLGGAVVFGLLAAALFIFPNFSIFGAKAVNERDTQIVYRDEGLTRAFENGKFILESTGAKIEVKMSHENYEGEGTIVINEASTGIAFNSLSRTLVEWTQTMYNGELYYRIKVLEPSGVVFSNKPTTVYINLPHRKSYDSLRHDFVLQNKYSDVNFSFVDASENEYDVLKIGDLVVESAASVNIPASDNISVKSVEIKSNNTKFVCQSPVLGNVVVSGSNGVQTFNTEIGGALTIKGNNNKFSGDSAGDLEFECVSGSLNMKKISHVNVYTVNASVNIDTVQGGGVVRTHAGNFHAGSVVGDFEFIAGNINQPTATASLGLRKISGDVNVENYGVGAISLEQVKGNVNIDSSQTNGGKIDVSFQDSASNCSVKILGYDGDINVKGINGSVDIEVKNWENGAGAANVYTQFNAVVGTSNVIKTGGYVSGHHDWGNVDIELANNCNNFSLYVYGATSAKSSSHYGYNKNNMAISKDTDNPKRNEVTVSGQGNMSGVVHVHTKQTLYLF